MIIQAYIWCLILISGFVQHRVGHTEWESSLPRTFLDGWCVPGQIDCGSNEPNWGFYGHRKINELAVFTLPPPLIGFFKKHIRYISEHSVDPDKRRHASRFEAMRHYIDLDHWGVFPFDNIPRDYDEAICKFGVFKLERRNGQIVPFQVRLDRDSLKFVRGRTTMKVWPKREFLKYFRDSLKPLYYEEVWKKSLTGDTFFGEGWHSVEVKDSFSDYGIVPYYLDTHHARLVTAMKSGDANRIMQLAAEYGHYISDAHVPLHTTENYNGQLSGQDGIHAFWESRIPELFAEKYYDFFVGRAEYISGRKDAYWQIVLDSHSEVDKVLGIEMELRNTFPMDRQYCYDERLNRTVRLECPEYAAAYQEKMGTMVEDRMRASIKAVGDLWYTAWVDAGQPNISGLEAERILAPVYDTLRIDGRPVGRMHSDY
ncbi:MAG TPA: zinc dependent phospholipase C family protein [Saprospiraceae bacterium]|nr:zinc dependent phospholipase C family protein [Saprospiraceae bacterium]